MTDLSRYQIYYQKKIAENPNFNKEKYAKRDKQQVKGYFEKLKANTVKYEEQKQKHRERMKKPEVRIKTNNTLKKYRDTYDGKKAHLTSEWKTKNGFKETKERLDEIFDRYWNAKNCEICNKLFVDKKVLKVADHDHNSGHFRNILCVKCNNNRGKIDRIKMLVNLEIHRYFLNK